MPADDLEARRPGQIDPGRLDHWAGGDAFAAACAGIEDVLDPAVQRFQKRNAVGFRQVILTLQQSAESFITNR